MPDALSLLNVNDARHLECLAWAVYDGALLVGMRPKLPGNCQWCTVLASLYKYINGGCDDAAHCPPYMLASWDCQEWTEALRQEGRLCSMRSAQQRASRPRRRSRSSSRCCSRTPAQGGWSGHSCSSPPNMPSRCHHRGPPSPDANTMPKLASAVNIPSYAWSSHSGGRMAQASLDEQDAWEDNVQTLHTPVCHIVQWDGGGRREPAQSGWTPPGEAQAGEHITRWMLVRRRLRRLSPSILIGGPPAGSK